MPTFASSQDVLKDSESKMEKATEATKKDFHALRTGRASTSLVEDIRVDYYGTQTPLKQMSAISTPDPKTIMIQPWDPSGIKDIEAAIQKSDLGLTPNNDGKVIRINIPALTEERRDELSKFVRKIAEEGRVSIRNARRDANEALKSIQKDGTITEDELRKGEGDVQKMTDKYIKLIDEALKNKEKELHTI